MADIEDIQRNLQPTPNNCQCEGSRATLYYNRNPDCNSSPVWVPHIDLKGDLNWSSPLDQYDETPRGKNVCAKTSIPGKMDVTVDGETGCDCLYEGNYVLMNMANRCSVFFAPQDILVLTDCITTPGAAGLRGCFYNFTAGANNPENGTSRKTFQLKPAPPCAGCECSLTTVMVCVPDADALVPLAVNQINSMGESMQALTRDHMTLQLSALESTVSSIVAPSLNASKTVSVLLGKSVKNIESDLQLLTLDGSSAVHLFHDARPNAGSDILEVNRELFTAYLEDLLKDFNAKLNGKVSVPTPQATPAKPE